MARKLRVEYEGAIYHILSRGNGKQDIYRDAKDRKLFLKALGETCEKTGWRVHAYCLMSNHFHLCLETPQANLVAGMKWLLGTYSSRFNRRHKHSGHLFAGRYKSVIVDGSRKGYLHKLCDYIHLNPVRAHLVADDQYLKDFPWTSYPLYLLPPTQRPSWLETRVLMGEKDIQTDDNAGRQRLELLMENRQLWEESRTNEAYDLIRRSWHFGTDEHRNDLLSKIETLEGTSRSPAGEVEREAHRVQASDLLEEMLRAEGITDQDLMTMRKGDPVKIRLAMEIRKRTTMSLKWIAEHLHMGTWTYVSNLLSTQRTKKLQVLGLPPSEWLKATAD
ncbi:MAG: transposase [Verrucomicrobiota bacterium]